MSAAQGANAIYLVPPPPPLTETNSGVTTWVQVVPKKPVRPTQSIFGTGIAANGRTTYIDVRMAELQKIYIFPDVEAIRRFLVLRHTVLSTLMDAIPELRSSFGQENIFRLELSRDDEHSQTLYAVAIWPGPIHAAVQALRRFEEDWWLDRMTSSTADLAFVYEIT